jgi:hypothetical protein
LITPAASGVARDLRYCQASSTRTGASATTAGAQRGKVTMPAAAPVL